MKLKSLAAVAVVSAMAAGNANANLLFDIYAGATAGFGGAMLMSDMPFIDGHKSYTAQSYGAVVGADIPLARLEVEYNYLTNSDTQLHLAMFNGYLKMPSPVVKPYIGAGAGFILGGKHKEYSNLDVKSTGAYQGMLGVTFDLPVIPFNIDVEGRVLYANDVFKPEGPFALNADKINLLQYDARVKLRYVF